MSKENGIPYDGFGNVIEMLRLADAPFRDKILRGIAARDPALAKRLVNALKLEMQRQTEDDSRATLERSQRAHATKNYGL
ncbi:MAG: hypothetical protein HUU37_09975 [Bdellovibrionales bacterium]|nr:hypothetical protein [Bdellovibrionales bacterium]